MDEIIEKEIINIEDMIYEITGVEVMLDSDLAKLYGVETKRINEAVKNNPKKFPNRYLFQLSEMEYINLKSKFSTSSLVEHGGSRKGHTAFTEQGVYMLATILKSDKAIDVSIRIMDTFVKMRHYINFNKTWLPNRFLLLEKKVDDNTRRIDELFDKFSSKDIIKDYILYDGEFYDAYSILIDILDQSKKEIIIIDNYAGKELLDILKNFDRKIYIVSKESDKILKKKYGSQYSNVTFIQNDSFHDRFIILDKKTLYGCGASFKDLGKKCFGIYRVEEKNHLTSLLEKLNIENIKS